MTGVILAGGQGRRMGGVDKGLQLFRGKTLVEWVIERLQPQVSELLINANQNRDQYQGYGLPVIGDEVTGFAGPLAGLHSALKAAACECVLTVPCDSPFLPHDLVRRMYAAWSAQSADVAVAWTGDQAHPVFCLTRRSLLPHLSAFLQAGGRKIDAWYADLAVARVSFDDQPDAFANFNTLDELRAADRSTDS